MTKRTWLTTLSLALALSSACGGDSDVPTAPPGGGNGGRPGDGFGDGAGDGGDTDGGNEVKFPDDKAGPIVDILSPKASGDLAPIVGGKVVVRMKITDDPAGVATSDDRLYASIERAGDDIPYDVKQVDDEFTVTFEATDFDSTADVTLTVHAEDVNGNVTTASHLMYLDTRPPWVSLDPPTMRFVEEKDDALLCSAPFDPLGESPVDGQVIEQESRIRAFVWERALKFPGATERFHAGVNEDEVLLFVQNDPDVPLLTDDPKDDDDLCDAVNEDAAANFVRLMPIKPKGEATGGEASDWDEAPAAGQFCVGLSEAKTDAPDPVCAATELTFVPGHEMEGKPPVVFGVDVSSSGIGCTGTSWDMQTTAGWQCVVTRAYDKSRPDGRGNLSFSKPIRLCRRLKNGDCEGAAPGTVLTPPAKFKCTDGCKLPGFVTNPEDDRFILYTK